MKRIDIYGRKENRMTTQTKILESWEGSQQNKELIHGFKEYLLAKGTQFDRIGKAMWLLRGICDITQKDLDKNLKKDIEKILATLETTNINQVVYTKKGVKLVKTNRKYSEATKSDYKKTLKSFYRWFEEDDPRQTSNDTKDKEECKKLYKFLGQINSTCKLKAHNPADVLTEQEIKLILEKGCRTEQDKAFISLLHETGCRIGEFLGIRIKDLVKGEIEWLVQVDGKTGERPRPFRKSIPYLLRWLDYHPTKNPDHYLWVTMEDKYKPLKYGSARKRIIKSFERVGLDKKKNPHWFRHSRASLEAPKYNEATLNKLFGWGVGSSMARRYVHISGKQVIDEYRKANGLQAEEEQEKPKPFAKCLCGRINETEAKYCSACGMALSLSTALKEKEYLQKAFELMTMIKSNPSLNQEFEQFKANIK